MGEHLRQPARRGGAYGALGNCAAVDLALDAVLGPDPTPCDQRTGPPVGSTAAPSGGPAVTPSGTGGQTGTTSGQGAGTAGSGTGSSGAAEASNANPLQQLLAPLLGGGS